MTYIDDLNKRITKISDDSQASREEIDRLNREIKVFLQKSPL